MRLGIIKADFERNEWCAPYNITLFVGKFCGCLDDWEGHILLWLDGCQTRHSPACLALLPPGCPMNMTHDTQALLKNYIKLNTTQD